MPELEPPDRFHAAAASGWLDLGLADEAAAELVKVSAPNQTHSDVLDLRWAIHAKTGDWEQAQETARQHLALDEDAAGAWLHLAYATRRVKSGGLPDAWKILLPALDRFPREPIIPFNLACYAAQMERLDEAWSWFQEAVRRSGNRAAMIKMALADDDLQPIWERIRAEKEAAERV